MARRERYEVGGEECGIFIETGKVVMKRIWWWSNCKPKPKGDVASGSRTTGAAMWYIMLVECGIRCLLTGLEQGPGLELEQECW